MDQFFEPVGVPDNMAARSGEAIIDLIKKGKLKHGERLPPQDVMAKRLGVSRTSLREALKELSYRGIIESRHGLGTFVCSALVTERETLEARLVLEPEIARMAAEKVTQAAAADLAALVDDMAAHAAALAYGEFSRMDLEFHKRLVILSGNAALERLFLALSDMTLHQQNIVQRIPGIMARSHQFHCDIARAVGGGKGALARTTMREHLKYTYAALVDHEEHSIAGP